MLTLPPRLQAVAALVRKDSFVADVGTDHAYLPIWLVENQIARGAVATDIAKGPLDRALKNIFASDLSSKISTALTPGLMGIDKYAPSDICICGMGSETIIQILSDSSYVKNSNVRLVLQPMTKSELLRKWLFENGYAIVDEDLCYDRNKLYQIIVAQFEGDLQYVDDYTVTVGTPKIRKSPYYTMHLKHILMMLNKKIDGLSASGAVVNDMKTMAEKINQEILEYDNSFPTV